MLSKGDDPNDPRGLIYEAYRIEAITKPDCRTIFLDWALGLPEGQGAGAAIMGLLARYRPDAPDHPMTQVLEEGLASAQPPRRRGGRKGRVS